ncbi:MAG TPA: ATP-binding protein [Saprospiraceae bacterium]|nr:ATP-binding protein [Saprospiraceae bacterium]
MSLLKRIQYLLMLLFTCSVGGSAAQPVYSFQMQDTGAAYSSFTDSLYILPDPARQLTITDILRSTDLAFRRPQQQDHDAAAVLWCGIRLQHTGSSTQHAYFTFCSEMDTIIMYAIDSGRVTSQAMTGTAIHPHTKTLPSRDNIIPVSLEPGEEKLLYFKIAFDRKVDAAHQSHIYLRPAGPFVHHFIRNYTWQAFYAGAMLLFGIISLFMFFMFREWVFIYFASLMVFLVLYFTLSFGFLEGLVFGHLGHARNAVIQIGISGIVLSLFGFFNTYLRLAEHMPRYIHLLRWSSWFTALVAHVMIWLGMDIIQVSIIHNVILAVWILILFYPVIRLAWKKDFYAGILLRSIIILFVSSLIYIAHLQNWFPAMTWARFAFQIGTLLFSGVLFYSLFERIQSIQSDRQRYMELDQLKSRFFTNLSHEFRTPLTLMMGPLQLLLEKTKDAEDKALLSMAAQHAQRQLELVNQLLDLSKLEAGKITLQARIEKATPDFKGMIHAYESLAGQKGITLEADIPDPDLRFCYDRDKMQKIISNLLTNAFKFTPAGGKVTVKVLKKVNDVIITVSDSGIGIAEADLPKIFDRFFQADIARNPELEGSGIGLALVREFVLLHQGLIKVESEKGKGTTFILTLPANLPESVRNTSDDEVLEKSAVGQQNNLFSTSALQEAMVLPQNGAEETEPQASRILVIEDHPDVRAFITKCLVKSFDVMEARDGDEGIAMALENLPDIIICDVMMPGQNGYEVCARLKSDIRTCHIPIILLTAKATREEKLEGLHSGADDYLLKPFDAAELEARVNNLIRSRQQLRERFATSITLKPSEMSLNSLDQTFIQQAMQAVEARMEDANFNIDALAQELGMSRPNLNRKLRALLNQSTNQFIQSVRLQRAVDLLRQRAGTVAEIAYQTGFSSPAYFIKCFKDHFGETPGQFSGKEV